MVEIFFEIFRGELDNLDEMIDAFLQRRTLYVLSDIHEQFVSIL